MRTNRFSFQRRIIFLPIVLLAVIGALILVQFNLSGLAGVPKTGLPTEFIFPGNDLVVYLKAGEAIAQGSTPYPDGPWTDPAVFHYSPLVAALLAPAFQEGADAFPFRTTAYLYLGAIILLLPLTWLVWRKAFHMMETPNGIWALTISLPLWLVYSQWFSDQNFLNIYTLLLLLDGILVVLVFREDLFLPLLIGLFIANTKPHYIYPFLIPLFLGRWRYFFKLTAGLALLYVAAAGLMVFFTGQDFGLLLYKDYLVFLTTIADHFPWSSFYLGYNHSWMSILHWLFGIQSWVPQAVFLIRFLLLLPILGLCYRWWRSRRVRRPQPALALGLALSIHLWAMISLDQLWEITSAIIAFALLMAVGNIQIRFLAGVIFIPFALMGFAQLGGWWTAWILDRPMDQLDIITRTPIIMATGLGLYTLLAWKNWRLIPDPGGSPGL